MASPSLNYTITARQLDKYSNKLLIVNAAYTVAPQQGASHCSI
jgi:hypothetical protein